MEASLLPVIQNYTSNCNFPNVKHQIWFHEHNFVFVMCVKTVRCFSHKETLKAAALYNGEAKWKSSQADESIFPSFCDTYFFPDLQGTPGNKARG